jgi:transglutaminase-like putative cysteine protease
MIHNLTFRSISWIINKVGISAIVSILLLSVVLSCLSYGLQTVVPILKDYSLLLYTFFGLITGWMLARLKLASWKIPLLSALIGTFIILIDLAQLLSPLLYLSREIINIIYQALSRPWNNPPDTSIFLLLLSDTTQKLTEVLFSTYQWVRAFISNQAFIRSSGSIFFWMLAVWATSVWAGWVVRRVNKPILGVLPAGILLASTLNYVREDTYLLIILLLGTLSLTSFMHYKSHERNWDINALDYPEDIRIDYIFAISAILLILTSLALITPSISLKPIASSVRHALSDQKDQIDIVADSLGVRDQITSENLNGSIQTPGLPRIHLLGSDPSLSQKVVMIVKTNESDETKFYWRAVTYDNYNGRGWSTAEISISRYDAGDNAPQIIYPTQRISHQEIQITRDIGGRLIAGGTLLSADEDYQVFWRSSTDMFGASINSPKYQVTSLINQASVTQLRSATQEYPNWITERYLTLTPDLPDRVVQLAYDLSKNQPTAYDKAVAIETYLRTFPYTLEVPSPPENQDVSDYFLFDLRKGYCDYYATSMVVLARAAGLPSRLVVGYASGIFDANGNRYIVTEADAHSWVEIFFPQFGWIEFEPTGSRSLMERPVYESFEYLPNASNYDALPPSDREEEKFSIWRLFPYITVTIFVITIIMVLISDDRRLWKTDPAIVVLILFRRLNSMGYKLEVPTSRGDTPVEFNTALKEKIIALIDYLPAEILTSRINENLNTITNLYIQFSYSPYPLKRVDRSNAIQSWYQVRFWFLLARITNFFIRIYRRIPRPNI